MIMVRDNSLMSSVFKENRFHLKIKVLTYLIPEKSIRKGLYFSNSGINLNFI